MLIARKTTKARFRFLLKAEELYLWLTAQYVAEVNYRHAPYQDSEDTKGYLWLLAQILTDPDSKFGIMLCGSCGNGKTTLLYAVRSLINMFRERGHFDPLDFNYEGLLIVDAKEVVNYTNDLHVWRRFRDTPLLAIDDMGKEPVEVLRYGNVTSPVLDLLEYRYQNQLFTMVSTNMAPGNVKGTYGVRLADRFKEMFEVIPFRDGSYREKFNCK